MAFTLDAVVPWGRSFAEYRAMFSLGDAELARRILGCGDGPASFNAEATGRGHDVVSCDPLYQFTASEIEGRVRATHDTVVRQLEENRAAYVWDRAGSPEQLGGLRMAAMRRFLADYERGITEGRYLVASLPNLPFRDHEFDLALVSHLLFTYTGHLSLEFHTSSLAELCRVAREVRVFPLLDLSGKESAYVGAVMSELQSGGHEAELLGTAYEFQKGGNVMMRVAARGGA